MKMREKVTFTVRELSDSLNIDLAVACGARHKGDELINKKLYCFIDAKGGDY